jgi:glycosyltransferase involved in cell wall biosynthesis
MKILHVYSSWSRGGAEKLMVWLARELEKNGFTNIIAAPRDSYITELSKSLGLGTRDVVLRGSFDLIGIWKLFRIASRERIDIVHSHQGKTFWPCIFTKWLLKNRLKVVFHRHAQLPHKFYSRSHYGFSDAVIAISEAVRKSLIAEEGVKPSKVRTIYNGTDLERFKPAAPTPELVKKCELFDKIVIGTAAAMNSPKGKGQMYLVEAAAVLKKDFPNARYLIVGTGPILDELKALSVTLGVDKEVIFAGYQEKVEDYLACMDIFCFLSWDKEGFGQVMVEAQAMGKPVIGTDIGGIPETFLNNVTGFLIPSENTKALTESLRVLLIDPQKRIKMGLEAVSFVRSRFSIQKMAGEVGEVYKSVNSNQ